MSTQNLFALTLLGMVVIPVAAFLAVIGLRILRDGKPPTLSTSDSLIRGSTGELRVPARIRLQGTFDNRWLVNGPTKPLETFGPNAHGVLRNAVIVSGIGTVRQRKNIYVLARRQDQWVAVGRVAANELHDAHLPAAGRIGIYGAGGGAGGIVVCLEATDR